MAEIEQAWGRQQSRDAELVLATTPDGCLPLPHHHGDVWRRYSAALAEPVANAQELREWSARHGLLSLDDLRGLLMFLEGKGSAAGGGRSAQDMWDAAASEEERRLFFSHVWPSAAAAALLLPAAFPEHVPLFVGRDCSADLSRQQCASLIAAGFFCLLPYIGASFSSINFHTFWSHGSRSQFGKMRCIMEYFGRLHERGVPEGVVTVHRRHLPLGADAADEAQCAWRVTAESDRPLLPFTVHAQGTIEDSAGALQVDFANEFIGGGALSGGCVQEEIRFMINPECLTAMALCSRMEDNECISIVGAERFSAYTGYDRTFAFAGPYKDETPRDERGRLCTLIVGMDAMIALGEDQYCEAALRRELLKAAAGFSAAADMDGVTAVATGNWGCGAFGGSIPVKSMLQWLAASYAGLEVRYFPFADRRAQGLQETVQALRRERQQQPLEEGKEQQQQQQQQQADDSGAGEAQSKLQAARAPVTCGQLWAALRRFCEERDPQADRAAGLFPFLLEQLA